LTWAPHAISRPSFKMLKETFEKYNETPNRFVLKKLLDTDNFMSTSHTIPIYVDDIPNTQLDVQKLEGKTFSVKRDLGDNYIPNKSQVLPELTRCYSESDYLTIIRDKEAYDYLRKWYSYVDVISDENYIHA